MKNIFSSAIFIALTTLITHSYATDYHFQVQPRDIHQGFVAEKIWLNNFVAPEVTVAEIGFTDGSLPADAKVQDPTKADIHIGMERGRAFAVVRVPAYTTGTQVGSVKQITAFTLHVTEKPSSNSTKRTTGFNDVPNSVLAQGTWYKIGITKTGLFKIDYNFLVSMGIKPSSITPANIRIFGNGGNMLSEDNSVSRPADLLENAIYVYDDGSGSFSANDYVIFYGVGTTAWAKDSVDQLFTHTHNLYADTAYYFITFNQGTGARIAQQPAAGTANEQVSSYNFYDVHDTEYVNPVDLGKNWYGEQFYPALDNTVQTFTFNENAVDTCAYVTVEMGGTTANADGNTFAVAVNGTTVGGASLPITNQNPAVMSIGDVSGWGACGSSTISVQVTFNSSSDEAGVGYMHYIEINGRSSLTMGANQMNFRDWRSVGADRVAQYELGGANSSTQVWDVTNPQAPAIMSGSLSGNTYSFTQDAAALHEFVAMNSSSVYTPAYIGTVDNQNLHGSGPVDLIIVAHPDFLDQAKQLAEYHMQHDNMRVLVATPQQVYNEFSSGSQDISAIRDFARMFYKRAVISGATTDLPSNILLFGGASYDYKNRVANNSNYVPVFESANSIDNINSFSTDDFYGFLDDNEDIENLGIYNALDIGVGRLPARNVDDANALVYKIIHYDDPNTLGPWRLASTFASCIYDGAGCHRCDAEEMAATVQTSSNDLYNEDKVYEDAIPLTSTPAGNRCPIANQEIDNDVYQGVFLMNYNGHGNTEVWSSERILTQADYNNWNNATMLPFMITATCDFGQFDQPSSVSAASQLVIRSGGGIIAVLTTTEAVFASYNEEINSQYLAAQLTRNTDGSWNNFGEGYRIGKNVTYANSLDEGTLINFRKFSLLGDPALTPTFPNYKIQLDSAIDGATMLRADTIKALGRYNLAGSVHDLNGNLLSGFNGEVYVTLYDKPTKVITITDPISSFYIQNSIIYKGKVSVKNGTFIVDFIAPLDIDYYYGSGKVSAYADNGTTDAAGADSTLKIGGYSSNPVANDIAPVVKPYINDSLFLNGGITGNNTSLFVSLFSQTGINVTGTEIGHDLTAIIDGNRDAPYILNNYYQTAPNTFQRGYLTFPLTGLTPGNHSIVVQAWDVNDNVGTGEVDFTVIDSTNVAIQQLMNYPNPFTNSTTFVFEHNQPGEELVINIEIYNTAGAKVKDIDEDITPTDSRTNLVTWDGSDNHGVRLPSGVYIYRLTMTTQEGFKSTVYQKLVIVR